MNRIEEKNPPLPRNVKLLGCASLLNDVASEMVYPLLPQFLIQVLGGNKLYLGLIEGAADTAASLLKLGSGGWSDRLGARKGFVVFGDALAAWHAWALFVGYAFFCALTEPAEKTPVASLVASQHRGLAYGWFNFAVGLATLPSSLLFGTLYQQYGVLAAFGCGAALAVAAAGILLTVSLPPTPDVENCGA